MKTLSAGSDGMANVVPARGGGVRDWQRWAPYAAVAWSLFYTALVIYWVVSGSGFPYTPETLSDGLGPLLGRFGPGLAWIVVMDLDAPRFGFWERITIFSFILWIVVFAVAL